MNYEARFVSCHVEQDLRLSLAALVAGLDPTATRTFEWRELDDKVSHAQAAAQKTPALPLKRWR